MSATRTTEVRDAIVRARVTGKDTCAEITTTDLVGITNLGIGNNDSLTTLKADDFDDLVNLTTLRLINNSPEQPAGGRVRRADQADDACICTATV